MLLCAGMLEHGRSSLAFTGVAADDSRTDAEEAETQLLRQLDTALRLLHSCQSRLAAAYQHFDVALAAAESRLPRAVIQSWRWHPPAATIRKNVCAGADLPSAVHDDAAEGTTTTSMDVGEPADDSSTTVESGDSDDHLCVICIGGLEAHEGGVRLPCGHLFHESCVAEWLRRNSSCPHCRAQLPG